MAYLNFDAASVEPAQPFEVIPPGKYICQITQSEMRPTKGGDGSYLWIELDILDGPCAGRKLWDKFNLQNKNQQAVEIAQRQLSALAHACGKPFVRESEELHLTPIEVTVRIKPAKDGYDASNEIRGYAPAGGAAPAAPHPLRQAAAPAPQAARPAAAAAGGGAPWRR